MPRNEADLATSEPPPELPNFDPALLDRSLMLHSDHMRKLGDGQLSQLVTYLERRDLLGGEDGTWLAGDGRDNVLVAIGGGNLISGGAGDDTLRGASGGDSLFGGAGKNRLFGGAGPDLLIGGDGSHMTGGAGEDSLFAANGVGTTILDGGEGSDALTGGDGADIFVIGVQADSVYAFTPGQDQLDLTALELTGWEQLSFAFSDEYDAGIIFRIGQDGLVAVMSGFDARTLTAADLILSGTPPAEHDTVLTIAAKAAGGAEGSGVEFTVTRSGSSMGPAFARWAVTGEALAGTMAATADDFVGGVLPGGLVVFADGQRQQTISFTTAGDLASEPNESYAVTLVDAPGGVNIAGARAGGLAD